MTGSLRPRGGSLLLLAAAAGCQLAARPLPAVPSTTVGIAAPPHKVLRFPLVMSPGEEVDLSRLADGVLPAPRAGEGWIWSSSAPATLVVTATSGRAKAVGVGAAKVEAGRHGAEPVLAVDVAVLQDARPIRLEGVPAEVLLAVGKRRRLVATVVRSDGTLDGNVRWASRDDTIVSVDPWTGEIVGERAGRASVEVAAIPGRDVRGAVAVHVTTGEVAP